MSTAPKVLLVEDSHDARQWLRGCVETAFAGAMVTEAASLREATSLFDAAANRAAAHGQSVAFDVVLVDIGLPDGSGIDLVFLAASRTPEAMIVVSTVFEDDDHLFRAIEAGAKGYVLKRHDTGRMVELLGRIRDGEPPLSPSIARRILGELRQRSQKNAQSPEIALTPREQEVLGLLGRGFQLSRVSSELGVSHNTASSHVKSIYRKLNISSRAEAAIAAMERGLFGGKPS